ncbi:hypothetical protein B0J12DRAFT_651944 [Macrophomina phaseolina]|uniref:Uncharacterized protein n=1 Tax=Macrophomina phaseolina TaxID=35725 RepID=A0ABQ8GL96_9PEZI|nr:hypothetical protein B0J12DRAFT_651944 [Macrophomina phaseolina]
MFDVITVLSTGILPISSVDHVLTGGLTSVILRHSAVLLESFLSALAVLLPWSRFVCRAILCMAIRIGISICVSGATSLLGGGFGGRVRTVSVCLYFVSALFYKLRSSITTWMPGARIEEVELRS